MAAFRTSLTTAADFIIARIRNASDIHEVAKKVLCFVDGEFISVENIEHKCFNHGWNSMVYEAWAWERQCRIHEFAQGLSQPERDALLLYAHFREPLDASSSDAQEALAEARRALYGELDDEFDNGYNPDAFEEMESLDPDEISSVGAC